MLIDDIVKLFWKQDVKSSVKWIGNKSLYLQELFVLYKGPSNFFFSNILFFNWI